MNEDRRIEDASDEELLKVLIDRHREDEDQDFKLSLEDALDALRYRQRGEGL